MRTVWYDNTLVRHDRRREVIPSGSRGVASLRPWAARIVVVVLVIVAVPLLLALLANRCVTERGYESYVDLDLDAEVGDHGVDAP